MTAASEVPAGGFVRARLEAALLSPIRAFRLRYLPLLMVYFAYGALGLIAVAESFWVKKALTLSPAELAALNVWITLPWTVKMVFGELVDSVPILGSQRRVYVFVGAAFIAAGMVLLAGAAGGWLTFASPENIYRLGAFISVLGVVIQDVVADAITLAGCANREEAYSVLEALRAGAEDTLDMDKERFEKTAIRFTLDAEGNPFYY